MAGPAVGQPALELGDPLYNEGWGHGLFVACFVAPFLAWGESQPFKKGKHHFVLNGELLPAL